MSSLYSHLVWLGAGAVCEPAGILSNAKRITLYEAREAACNKLQQKLQPENINVIQALLTTTNSIENFTEYNLAEFSAIQLVTGLKNLFPGIKAVNSDPINGTLISDAIHALQLTDANNLLIVDIPDSNLAFLTVLEAAKQLHLFRTIHVQTANEPLYENASSTTDITDFLQAHGYLMEKTINSDPDLPWLIFNLNPLWSLLKKTQQNNSTLNAEIVQLRHTLQQLTDEKKQQIEAAIAKNIVSKQEFQQQEMKMNQLKNILTAAQKSKEDIEQRLPTVQQELMKTKESAEQEREKYKQQLEAIRKAKQDIEQELIIVKQQLIAAQKEITTVQSELTQAKVQIQEKIADTNSQQILEQKLQKMFTDQTQQFSKEISVVKNHINNGLNNTAKQLESFIGIQNYLEHGIRPLSFHGWPISPDIGLYIAGLIDSNNYDVIIEFGSGTSTVLMAKSLISKQKSIQTKELYSSSENKEIIIHESSGVDLPARIITFEHNHLYYEKTKIALTDNNVGHLVDLIHAPLIDYECKDGSQYLYYNCADKLQELSKIFKGRKANILVLVDGPPGSTNKNARFPALPHLLNILPEHLFTVVMDDYGRNEEKEIVDSWRKIAGERHLKVTIEEMKCEKGCATIFINHD